MNIHSSFQSYSTVYLHAQPAQLSTVGRHSLSDDFVSTRPVPSIDESSSLAQQSDHSLPSNSDSRQSSDNTSEVKDKQREQQEKNQMQQEQREVSQLAARDREVRAHEQAHAAVGGQFAGAPNYEFKRGPDGVNYAVGGEVLIDVGAAATPAETIAKMQTVRRAALAPADPSAQDRSVAAQASLQEAKAQQELAMERKASREADASGEASVIGEANKEASSESNNVTTSPSSSEADVGRTGFIRPNLQANSLYSHLSASSQGGGLNSRAGALFDHHV